MSLRTPLAKVKGLGSAKTGTVHWWNLRVLALALIPLTIWFICTVIQSIQQDQSILLILQSPVKMIAMLLLVGTMLYHGMLGMQEIIEDYVHAPWKKITLLLLNQWITILTVAAAFIAIITWHLTHNSPIF